MKLRRPLALPLFYVIGACAADATPPASSDATALVRDVQQTFATHAAAPGVDAHSVAPLGSGTIASMVVDGDALRLALSGDGRESADVRLAATASGASRIADRASSLGVGVRLAGALDAPAVLADGFVVHRGAVGGADVIRRVQKDGFEDFASFAQAPAVEELVYDVALDESVAGLRLVENALELLDHTGDPRLRVSAPYVIDADGARHAATLAVRGCAFDDDPAAPWGRAVTAPGARSCRVVVAWADAHVRYPALVDPSWTSTAGGMAYARAAHQSVAVNLSSTTPTYRILVAGGYNTQTGQLLSSAEIYNPATGTWSITGSMKVARMSHAMTSGDDSLKGNVFYPLAPTKVLASGGFGAGFVPIAHAERYDAALGTWTAVAPMNAPRAAHGSVGLGALATFVAGGYGANGSFNATSETYAPSSNTWTLSSTNMSSGRAELTLTGFKSQLVFGGGSIPARIVAVGGKTGLAYPANVATTVDQYDVASGAWTSVKGALRYPVYAHTATGMIRPDGSQVVVVAGGLDSDAKAVRMIQEVNKDSLATIAGTNPMLIDRAYHVAFALPSYRVSFVGGESTVVGTQILSDAEVFDVSANSPVGTRAPTGGQARALAASARLPDGRVFVSGGYNVQNNAAVTLADTVVYTP